MDGSWKIQSSSAPQSQAGDKWVTEPTELPAMGGASVVQHRMFQFEKWVSVLSPLHSYTLCMRATRERGKGRERGLKIT